MKTYNVQGLDYDDSEIAQTICETLKQARVQAGWYLADDDLIKWGLMRITVVRSDGVMVEDYRV